MKKLNLRWNNSQKHHTYLLNCSVIFFLFQFINSDVVAKNFQISEKQSEIRILTYKAGLFSGLAHNHVIVGKKMAGMVMLNQNDLTQSSFQIKVPVKSLIIDKEEHRLQEGSDFDGVPSKDEIEEIRETMLSESSLNAEQHPFVEIQSKRISGEVPNLEIIIQLAIRGQSMQIKVPVKTTIGENIITAQGKINFKQTDFGMEPFQILLGSVKVKDEILLKFNITAHAI